jgi:hypothetical protein
VTSLVKLGRAEYSVSKSVLVGHLSAKPFFCLAQSRGFHLEWVDASGRPTPLQCPDSMSNWAKPFTIENESFSSFIVPTHLKQESASFCKASGEAWRVPQTSFVKRMSWFFKRAPKHVKDLWVSQDPRMWVVDQYCFDRTDEASECLKYLDLNSGRIEDPIEDDQRKAYFICHKRG